MGVEGGGRGGGVWGDGEVLLRVSTQLSEKILTPF